MVALELQTFPKMLLSALLVGDFDQTAMNIGYYDNSPNISGN